MSNQGTIKIHALKCGSVKYPGNKTRYGVYSYLVEHPKHGKILIDTGLDTECEKRWPKYLAAAENPTVTKEETVLYQLENLGLKAEDIDLLILTHLDADGIDALSSFAGKAKRIMLAELEYFYSCRMVYKLRQNFESWIKYCDLMERPYFVATRMGPQGRGYDIFGDESVIMIYTPGHTDGQIMLMVSHGNNGRILSHDGIIFGGDYTVFSSDAVFEPMTFDKKGQEKAKAYLETLKNDRECLEIFPLHSCETIKEYLEY